MKTRTTVFRGLATLAGATLLLAASVSAGEQVSAGKAVAAAAEPPLSSLIDPITGELSAGYDSAYMFRGFNLGQEAIWTGIELYVPLAFPAGNYTLTLGAWYVNPTQGAQNTNSRGALDDELDLYASIGTTLGAFDLELIYNYYSLGPEATGIGANNGVSDQNEVGLAVATTVGRFDLGFSYFYNFDAGDQGFPSGGFAVLGDLTHYFEPSVGTTFALTDRIDLVLNALAGWYSDQFSHLQYTAALPIRISETVTFEPYAAYLDDMSDGTLAANKGGTTTDDLFFGASLSVSF